MSKGANSQAGFNAQNWAALSLFVQYSAFASFRSIELEQPKLADFVLVFDGKRIICESKKSHITYAGLRNILDTIPNVGIKDEILVICTSTGPHLKEDLENAKYFPRIQEKLVKQHRFTARHLDLLSKVNIWIVDQDMNENIVRSLLGERFQSWLPDDELDDLMSSLLIKNIYKKSAKGQAYTKVEFNDELTRHRELLKIKDDYRHSERTAKEHINKLLNELSDADSRLQSEHRLKAIIADSRLHYFALREVSKVTNLSLPQWDNLWRATFSSYYSREVLDIFAKNIKDKFSANYVVDFLKKNSYRLRFRSMEEYEFKSVADILMKAVDMSDSLTKDAYELLRTLYEYSTENPLYIDRGTRDRDKWLLGELAKDFQKLYAKGNVAIKDEMVEYIYTNFDIVDEESNYWHHTPFEFFEILKQDILTKPQEFKVFLGHLHKQYQKNYSRFKIKYDGWELMGGSVSNFGGDYAVHDKTFISKIIGPYINTLHDTERWAMVTNYAASRVGDVSPLKPDFMNRALIPFLMEQYATGSEKAFKILSRFIGMRKGIPNKAELIFYYTRSSQKLSLDQKWQLLEVAIKEFGFPVNIFMDQILQQLLERSYPQAIKTFSDLIDNEAYMERQILFDATVINSIEKVLNQPATFNLGTILLNKFLHSEYFTTLDSFHSYDAKTAILTVLGKDFEEGVKILHSLVSGKPSENQQRVFGALLRDTPDELLNKVFATIIQPELKQMRTASAFAKKYTNVETRENFIWFAEKLSKKHEFESSFYIVDFFLNDPSPAKGNEYDKEVIDGKHDFSINTVRGCLAWALLQVNSIAGKPYVNRAFETLKKLCTDESLYVRQMSLMTLEALANNRHTTMPNGKEWFMDYPTAQGIEVLAFDMLKDKSNHHNVIMQHLARVFNRLRTINVPQTKKIVSAFTKYGDTEALKELDTLLIFLAEFREGAFSSWPKSRGTVHAYNPNFVQETLKNFLENSSEEHRGSLVWHLVKLPEEPVRNNTDDFDRFFNISMKYLPYAIKRYDHHLYSSIHRFIESYIDKKFDDCYKLWKMSLAFERPAIIAVSKEGLRPGEYNWWPYHHNGSILLKVLNKLGIDQFLKDVEYLVDYPDEVMFAYDFETVLVELEKIRSHQDDIKRIYEKVVGKNYLYNDSYDRWLTNCIKD